MDKVWILGFAPDCEEGRIIGAFTSAKAAEAAWLEESDGRPLPAPDSDGDYCDNLTNLYLVCSDVIA